MDGSDQVSRCSVILRNPEITTRSQNFPVGLTLRYQSCLVPFGSEPLVRSRQPGSWILEPSINFAVCRVHARLKKTVRSNSIPLIVPTRYSYVTR
jgi:hypothetical protein